ncbi:hypothetical protein FO454_00020 [Staphylococcus lugdunensis]|uniref:Uncharacterized protein n=1 Tax=Staphylococcus lugdunensis TaxID=28035 RepID=A0ABX6BYU5_STALU|nr:hypothetical protein B7454_04170 [Staphylococcus lugdunensis]ARJ15697.1 hypothetical protein B6N54_03415 [Staphylococcus lugdunensis]ARJ29088.1 hypothetical protein B6N84_03445 [Staphylococcus lugdunensis]QEX27743.1 hypothetical protein FO459_12160 [Staphylococcus lugdunensis]QEX32502.1 hypothetical protein FO457_02630 [Staphylococcus lugdunensis]
MSSTKTHINTPQSSERGPNKKKCNKHFHGQRKLGWGPNKKKCNKHFHGQRKVGAKHRKTG